MFETRTPSRRPGLQRPGESDLRRLDWVTLLRAAPGQIAALGKVVPASHAAFQEGVATVTCVCGEGLPFSVPPAHSERCNCGRVFVNIGGDEVRVCRTEALDPA